MIGEIGGDLEIQAAAYIKEHITNPAVAFIAGQSAPAGPREWDMQVQSYLVQQVLHAKKKKWMHFKLQVRESLLLQLKIGKTVREVLSRDINCLTFFSGLSQNLNHPLNLYTYYTHCRDTIEIKKGMVCETFQVMNVKCGGCANTLKETLSQTFGEVGIGFNQNTS